MLGNRIKERREKKGLLQKDIANFVGVSQQAVARWEKGETEPDSATLVKLAELLECSVDYLLGRTNVPTPIETIAAHHEGEEWTEEELEEIEAFKEFVRMRRQQREKKE